jgi:NADH-quinone oxidoreductase subunit N
LQLQDKILEITGSFGLFVPELFLALAFLAIILFDLISPSSVLRSDFWHGLCLAILAWALVLVFIQIKIGQSSFLFSGMLFLDTKALFFKVLILATSLVWLLHSWLSKRTWPGEFFALVLAITFGLLVMTMAVNLLSIYLSVAFVSLASYLLTALLKDKKSTEAAIKYLLFGAISSAITLYGMSLLYGLTGTLSITDPQFAQRISQADPFVQTLLGGMLLAGLLYKISAVPFHFWNPDVYQAAPMPTVSFFSIAPKAAGLLVLLRLLNILPADFTNLLAVIALLSITIGNFSALWQQNLKRLLAYSSIAQIGFILVGYVAFSDFGFRASVFYLATYLFASMGAFLMIDLLSGGDDTKAQLNNLAGLGHQQPFVGVLLLVAMLSLVGLPLTVGFSAKLFVFSALWQVFQQNANPVFGLLLAWGLLNTALALFYYLKIPFVLFFKEVQITENEVITINNYQKAFALLLTLPIVILFFKSDWLMNLIAQL